MTTSWRRSAAFFLAVTLALGAAGCAAAESASGGSALVGAADDNAGAGVADSTIVHSFAVVYDQDDYDAMIATFLSSGEKEWITASVTIDGVTYDQVGLKLKGNSSLRDLSTDTDAALSATRPESLPWVIRLDKFVDGQSRDGATEFVVRASSSQTALNEAVALDLLDAAGLAAQAAVSARFSANGSDEVLRLIVENPTDAWMQQELGEGALYKAEAGGDYSYRGDDPSAYAEVFDQEAGERDLTPLIDFLQWINEASDDEFAAGLDAHLDVEAFATYLAFQDLVDNRDDIDGPGNNSYLYYDPATSRMTVVNWDLNLAFGQANVGGTGGRELRDAPGEIPEGAAPGGMPGDGAAPEGMPGAGGRGGPGGGNVLAERFLADSEFEQLYQHARQALQAELFDSGAAQDVLSAWSDTLSAQASDLVSATQIATEAQTLSDAFPG